MTRPSEDDRAAVDRAFAELVAGYHLTADRPDLRAGGPERTGEGDGRPEASEQPAEVARAGEPDSHWADEHPLFHYPDPEPEPEPVEPVEPRYVPDPLPPLPAPAIPALLGWIGIGWAALVVLAAAFGARFPGWVGWVAVLGFLGGFAILVTRLPRHRPPEAGDGAVL